MRCCTYTLRDLQRLHARQPWAVLQMSQGYGAHVQVWRSTGEVRVCQPGRAWRQGAVLVSTGYRGDDEIERRLDRLISRLGPDWPAEQRHPSEQARGEQAQAPRPKGIDEVADVSDDPGDGRLHGGDGSSGECDAPAQTTRREAQSPQDVDTSDGSGTRGAESGVDGGGDNGSHGTGAGVAEDAPGRSESVGGGGDPAASARDDQDQRHRGPEPAHPDGGSAHEEAQVQPGAARGDDRSSDEHPARVDVSRQRWVADSDASEDSEEPTPAVHTPTEGRASAALPALRAPLSHDGGWHGTLEAACRRGIGPRDVRGVLRSIERLCRGWIVGTGQEPSPRVSGRRLVTEIAGRSYRASRWRREEQERPLVLLLCDVSGSCSSVCDATLAVARAVSERLSEVDLVVHSNGWPEEWIGRPDLVGDVAAWWSARVRGRQLAGVIAWGDWDAGAVYAQLSREGAPVVWLDSHLARCVDTPERRWTRPDRQAWERCGGAGQPSYWVGVSGAGQGERETLARTAVALRRAARAMR